MTADAEARGARKRDRGRAVLETLPDVLGQEFVNLGLSPYESRVLLALMQLGSANTAQLTSTAKVPRASIYPILESLGAKGVATRVPGEGPAVWATPGRDEVLDRLCAAEEDAQAERLRRYRERSERMRVLLAESLPDTPSVSLPYAHVIQGAQDVKRAYDRMVAQARGELVMFTRSPYATVAGAPNKEVLAMLERGVATRVIYDATQLADPDARGYRAQWEAYNRAGVQARVFDDLPVKLVVADRRVTLIGMVDPVAPEANYPTFTFVDHRGFAAFALDAFERSWAAARPWSATGGGEESTGTQGRRPGAKPTTKARTPRPGRSRPHAEDLARMIPQWRPDRRLTTAEVAAALGIKPATIYAYVSRGLLHPLEGPDKRTSTFDPEEVARLAAEGRRAR